MLSTRQMLRSLQRTKCVRCSGCFWEPSTFPCLPTWLEAAGNCDMWSGEEAEGVQLLRLMPPLPSLLFSLPLHGENPQSKEQNVFTFLVHSRCFSFGWEDKKPLAYSETLSGLT